MSLNQGHRFRSRVLLCAAGLWLGIVALCAGRVISDGHGHESEAARVGQAHHDESEPAGHDRHGPSGNCCEDIRSFPASEFQSFAIVAPPSAVVLDFLALDELSARAAVQQNHAVRRAQNRGPPRASGFVEILLRKSIPGRAPPVAA